MFWGMIYFYHKKKIKKGLFKRYIYVVPNEEDYFFNENTSGVPNSLILLLACLLTQNACACRNFPEFADRSINLNTTDKPVSTIIGRKTTTDFTTQVSRIPTIEPPSICYSFQRIKVNETVIIETLVNGSLVNMTVETSRFENVTKAVNCSDITPGRVRDQVDIFKELKPRGIDLLI